MQLIVFPIGAQLAAVAIGSPAWAPSSRKGAQWCARGKVGICIVRLCKQAVGRRPGSAGAPFCAPWLISIHLRIDLIVADANQADALPVVRMRALLLLHKGCHCCGCNQKRKRKWPKNDCQLEKERTVQESVTAAEGEVALSGFAATSKRIQ